MAGGRSRPDVRAIFAGIAPRYDALNHILSLGWDRLWRRRVAREVRLRPGERVLDLCSGTGDLLLAILRRERAVMDAGTGRRGVVSTPPHAAPSGGPHAVGVDFCPEMLFLARGKARRRGHEVSLCAADAQALPFPAARFDVATVAFGLRNVGDRPAAIREWHRVLRPGGRIAILEFGRPRARWLRALYRPYRGCALPWIGQTLTRSRIDAYGYLASSIQEFEDVPTVRGWLESAGFAEVRDLPLTGGIVNVFLARSGGDPQRPGPGAVRAAGSRSRPARGACKGRGRIEERVLPS